MLFYGGWGWMFGALVTVLFWGGVVWMVMALCRSFSCRSRGWSSRRFERSDWSASEDAEQILARRYASGEIDEEEFHRRLDHLRSREPRRS
jgi:putative membrane protein